MLQNPGPNPLIDAGDQARASDRYHGTGWLLPGGVRSNHGYEAHELIRMASTFNTGRLRRFSVQPGITCLWQVNDRNSIVFDEWTELYMQ